MKTPRRNWNREELLLALNLYCRLSFGQLHKNNKNIKQLAQAIDRTPSSIAYKLCNFAHIDPSLKQKGASNCSKLDRTTWDEFWSNPEKIINESNNIWQKNNFLDKEVDDQSLETKKGIDKMVLTKQRVNQSFFRKMILAAYNNSCCITNLPIPELLRASHILPWSEYKDKRLEPTNGLCLSSTYDCAFDRNLISFDEDYRLILSSGIKDYYKNDSVRDYFFNIEGKQMTLPRRFLPKQEYLQIHREQLIN